MIPNLNNKYHRMKYLGSFRITKEKQQISCFNQFFIETKKNLESKVNHRYQTHEISLEQIHLLFNYTVERYDVSDTR